MSILVTGGAGYIGSHTCVELLNAGKSVIIVDNFSNSKPEAVQRIEEITGKSVHLYTADILDKEAMEGIFQENDIEAVIHFAGLKAVGESVRMPIAYYHNNISGTLVLCDVMRRYECKRMVFSSSATVYGNPHRTPIQEDFPLSATNPYGRTKLMIEEILRDLHVADDTWSISLLRYFNPIGAHESGRIGEDPSGIPNNLMPYITQVAIGKLEKLSVFGNDYDTHDGTGVRDYIHVVDLAKGHLAALEYIMQNQTVEAVNLGTGTGYSVLDLVKAFEKATDVEVAYEIAPRRPGDIATCYADPSKALELYGWKTEKDIEQMCKDSWNWQSNNPQGYK